MFCWRSQRRQGRTKNHFAMPSLRLLTFFLHPHSNNATTQLFIFFQSITSTHMSSCQLSLANDRRRTIKPSHHQIKTLVFLSTQPYASPQKYLHSSLDLFWRRINTLSIFVCFAWTWANNPGTIKCWWLLMKQIVKMLLLPRWASPD